MKRFHEKLLLARLEGPEAERRFWSAYGERRARGGADARRDDGRSRRETKEEPRDA